MGEDVCFEAGRVRVAAISRPSGAVRKPNRPESTVNKDGRSRDKEPYLKKAQSVRNTSVLILTNAPWFHEGFL